MSYVQGNPVPMLSNIIENASKELGEQYNTHLVDKLSGHQVWLKDINYVDADGLKKRCESLEEYFSLPPKTLTITKKPISRVTCRLEAGECAFFG